MNLLPTLSQYIAFLSVSLILFTIMVGLRWMIGSKQISSIVWKASLLLPFITLLPWSLLSPVQSLSDTLSSTVNVSLFNLSATSPIQESISAMTRADNTSQNLFWLVALLFVSVSFVKAGLTVFQILTLKNRLSTMPCDRTINDCFSAIPNTVEILKSDTYHSPFLYGLIKPRLVVPKDFFEINEHDQHWIILHEAAHIRRGDLSWFNLSHLLTDLLWFLPHLRWFRLQLEDALEIECDRSILDRYPESSVSYGGALINAIRRYSFAPARGSAAFGNLKPNGMKQRIQAITEHKKGRSTMMNKLILAGVTLACTVSAFAAVNVEDGLTPSEYIAIHKQASKRKLESDTPKFNADQSWQTPMSEYRLTSKFKAVHKIRKNKPHLGIDLAAPEGTPIMAVKNGTVIIADNSTLHKNHGNVIVLDHGNGEQSMYSHLKDFKVKPGDVVNKGSVIGSVGSTGRSTGPHLHMELIIDGTHVDPLSLLR